MDTNASHFERPVLITGGAGFIGTNIADDLAARGRRILVVDCLSRPGSQDNARWLKSRYGDRIEIDTADIRSWDAVKHAVSRASAVLHLAGQVAVTTSIEQPVADFEINARGTLYVLDAVRLHNPHIPLIVASTNKVYGPLFACGALIRRADRYEVCEQRYKHGIAEDTPLDLYSPYGCSKGVADQYAHDYARIFGLRTVVMRMSCIYGPHQYGTEDQGWIAHFLIAGISERPLTIYGDGLQVRDALHVSDASAAWIAALDHIDGVKGRVFNLGGGLSNSVSIRELLAMIAEVGGSLPNVSFGPWRPGDQPWYVSDIRGISSALGWRPRIGLRAGLRSLQEWLESTVNHPRRGAVVSRAG